MKQVELEKLNNVQIQTLYDSTVNEFKSAYSHLSKMVTLESAAREEFNTKGNFLGNVELEMECRNIIHQEIMYPNDEEE